MIDRQIPLDDLEPVRLDLYCVPDASGGGGNDGRGSALDECASIHLQPAAV